MCLCVHSCTIQKAETHNKVMNGGITDLERTQLDEQISKMQQLLEASSNRTNELEDALETQMVRCGRTRLLSAGGVHTPWP